MLHRVTFGLLVIGSAEGQPCRAWPNSCSQFKAHIQQELSENSGHSLSLPVTCSSIQCIKDLPQKICVIFLDSYPHVGSFILMWNEVETHAAHLWPADWLSLPKATAHLSLHTDACDAQHIHNVSGCIKLTCGLLVHRIC